MQWMYARVSQGEVAAPALIAPTPLVDVSSTM
jgi:hypothetical protein